MLFADDKPHDTHGVSFSEDQIARNVLKHRHQRRVTGRLRPQSCCIPCDGCQPFEMMSSIVWSLQTRTCAIFAQFNG